MEKIVLILQILLQPGYSRRTVVGLMLKEKSSYLPERGLGCALIIQKRISEEMCH